jgi:hypothetical protein
MTETDPRVTKRRVTMANFVTRLDEENVPVVERHEAVDYVLPEMLDVYVADAKSRWQSVVVSDEPDAGPGGYDGDTAQLDHLIGRSVDDFACYGDPSNPANALDEWLGK